MKFLPKRLLLLFAFAVRSGNSSRLIFEEEPPRAPGGLGEPYYFRTTNLTILGVPNATAALGNPLKGLIGGVRWAPPPLPNNVPLTMEWYNLGLAEVMIGNNTYDWTVLDNLLSGSASRSMHGIFSFFIHWPGQPLYLPEHLRDVPMINTTAGPTPNYNDPRMLEAYDQFIMALGARYDGDSRVAFIHVALIGFWGEFHCYPDFCVSESTKSYVVDKFTESFKVTQLQVRYPENAVDETGLYDASFAYSTLDREANGGGAVDWFFWPKILSARRQDLWKTRVMGGETSPVLQGIIFKDNYPAGTESHQDFKLCVDVTHMTYMLHHHAFINGGYSGNELERALAMHTHMGYNFYVSEVAASESLASNGKIDIAVTVIQSGVAPFYYDLGLELDCYDLPNPFKLPYVDSIIERGESKTFTFTDVPDTRTCLSSVALKLDSSMTYADKPIRFAQGIDGTVEIEIPLAHTTSKTPAPIEPAPTPTSPGSVFQADFYKNSDAKSMTVTSLPFYIAFLCFLVVLLLV